MPDDNKSKTQPTLAEVFEDAIKMAREVQHDTKPLTATEFNEGLTALKVMVSEHISTLTIVKFVADKLEAFPNSEERTILLQKMKQEHMHNIKCLDSVVGLLHDFPKLAARQPGSVRFFAKKAKESTNAQFIEEHENLRYG